ncbi:RNA-dependent RNA polymerase [Agapanthus carlavirus B]|uniref:RNA-dependent RNA polymerase n=1 Tax=Agapanthus carlavirus B TaxID=2838076 RepID=A0A8E7UE35_9VIRU|nr:RNA-dependent RNA polymerase [Agapanthus carlavirus B]QVY47450.1 RNA-dependent RNA polymerase [Agapanthus carlavirus B]
MALTYRSHIEDVMTSFTSAEQSTISAIAVNGYRKLETENFDLFNYGLSPRVKEKLSKSGIYLSPYSGIAHSHPACKTLENYMLYKVLPSYIDASFYLVGIKKNKVDFLKKRNKNMDTVSVINRYVTSKDKMRYGSDFVRLSAEMPSTSGRNFESTEGANDWVPKSLRGKGRNFFLHDEIHYWPKEQLISFLESVRPKTLLATLVCPPELLTGAKTSFNKWCYEFEIIENSVFFYPDGCRSEGYFQPLKCTELLGTNKIELDDGSVYCVDLLHSKFAHHLIAITEGELITETRRSFGNFEAISTKHIDRLSRNAGAAFPISFQTVSKIYRYLRTLQKPDLQSAMAKLSQIVPEPTGFEIKFIQEFAHFVITTDSGKKHLLTDLMSLFKAKMFSLLPDLIAKHSGDFKSFCLDEFINDLAEYTFIIELKTMRRDRTIISIAKEVLGTEDVELEKEVDIEGFFTGTAQYEYEKNFTYRKATSSLVEGKFELEFSSSRFLNSISNLFKKSYMNDYSMCVNECDVTEILGVLFSKRGCTFAGILKTLQKEETCKTIFNRTRLAFLRNKRVFIDECSVFRWFLNQTWRRGNMKYLEYAPTSAFLNKGLWGKIILEVKNFDSSSLRHNIDAVRLHKNRGSSNGGSSSCSKTTRANEQSDDINVSSVRGHASVEDKFFMASSNGKTAPLAIECNIENQPERVVENVCIEISNDPQLAGFLDLISKQCLKDNTSIVSAWHIAGSKESAISDLMTKVPIFDELLSSGDSGSKSHFLIWSEEFFVDLLTNFLDFFVNAKITPFISTDLAFKKCILDINSFDCRTILALSVQFNSDPTIATPGQRSNEPRIEEIADDSATIKEADSIPSDCVIEESSESELELEADGNCEVYYGACKVSSKQVKNSMKTFKEISVPADGDCFWHSIGYFVDLNGTEVKSITREKMTTAMHSDPELHRQMSKQFEYAEKEAIAAACVAFKMEIRVHLVEGSLVETFDCDGSECAINLKLSRNHFCPVVPKNDCSVIALCEALGRSYSDILKVLSYKENLWMLAEITDGEGASIETVEKMFKVFGLNATLSTAEGVEILNEEGRIKRNFTLDEGHLTYIKKGNLDGEERVRVLRRNSYSPASISLIEKAGTKYDFKPDLKRAKKLSSSLHQGLTGVISSELFNQKRELIQEETHEPLVRQINVITGTFGSGKSTLFKEFARRNPMSNILFVTPRKSLAKSIEEELLQSLESETSIKVTAYNRSIKPNSEKGNHGKRLPKNFEILTFEKFLHKAGRVKNGQCVFIDEMQLYPPGYLDLVLCLIKVEHVKIFIFGDVCQSDYDNEKDRNIFMDETPCLAKILEGTVYKYAIRSLRFLNSNFIGRLPCTITNKCPINEPYLIFNSMEDFVQAKPENIEVCLVSSFEEKQILKYRVEKQCEVLTYGESTGRTYNLGLILITQSSYYTNERRWLTALSRFKRNIVFLNLTGETFENVTKMYADRALGKFVYKTATNKDLTDALPGFPNLIDSYAQKVGKDQGKREEKVMGDPWLKSMIELAQIEDQEVETLEEVLPKDYYFKTHLPRSNIESIRANWLHRLEAKEFRERYIRGLVTDQFKDDHHKGQGIRLTNAAERFEAIYPRHKTSDTATFLMAVRKRLRFSKPSVECAKLNEAKNFGEHMLKLFLKKVPIKPCHNERFMNEARHEFYEKKTSKSSSMIANHAGRSCRDWLADVGFIFIKSQICTKFEKRFVEAKAAQTIVCFQHAVLCRFAPYMRYIEKKLFEVLPKNFYVHSGKGLDELNTWVIQNNFSGVCTESDYEAFDASQDHYIMAFELELMKYLGLPKDLINDYIYIKTSLGSKLGNFAIMRFSGEASTFLFNTMANMLFTFMKYDLNGSESICFAGDDMCASKKLRLHDEHKSFLDRLRLKAKVNFVKKPTFCGWNLTLYGIYKKPQLVFERLCIAKETGNLANCIDNYAIEVSYAYKLGERIANLMGEEELENHYMCVRTIIQNKRLIKSNVLKDFQNEHFDELKL